MNEEHAGEVGRERKGFGIEVIAEPDVIDSDA
jgi:hypothetical protein